jgi:hypothetical protein
VSQNVTINKVLTFVGGEKVQELRSREAKSRIIVGNSGWVRVISSDRKSYTDYPPHRIRDIYCEIVPTGEKKKKVRK